LEAIARLQAAIATSPDAVLQVSLSSAAAGPQTASAVTATIALTESKLDVRYRMSAPSD
jgi:hypothetical protein